SWGPLEGVLILLGVYGALRWVRWYLGFVLLGFAFAGIGFCAYANIDISLQYTGWVFERFFLLPHVLLAPLVGLGLAWLSDLAADLTSSFSFPELVGKRVIPAILPVVAAGVALGMVPANLSALSE